ncbi:MAG: hypothetical protein D6741_19030 [Planctomycetota bacterium]|nr:MAG: hypothetical protein D6741_19030 [Planctomycetota bacterium]
MPGFTGIGRAGLAGDTDGSVLIWGAEGVVGFTGTAFAARDGGVGFGGSTGEGEAVGSTGWARGIARPALGVAFSEGGNGLARGMAGLASRRGGGGAGCCGGMLTDGCSASGMKSGGAIGLGGVFPFGSGV